MTAKEIQTEKKKNTPRSSLLNTSLWSFSFHSLFKEYGRGFFKHIAFPHPFRTLRGVYRYNIRGAIDPGSSNLQPWQGGKRSLIGLGFCLKPLEPPCPSGRPNHDCQYLEENFYIKEKTIPLPCQGCMIRKIGLSALRCRSSFYIMTSAKDILYDLLLPSIRDDRFSAVLLGLCRYSFEPFKIALFICSLEAGLFSFAEGDCKDFKTWSLADKGIKNEQTALKAEDADTIVRILDRSPQAMRTDDLYIKSGNIFYCHD